MLPAGSFAGTRVNPSLRIVRHARRTRPLCASLEIRRRSSPWKPRDAGRAGFIQQVAMLPGRGQARRADALLNHAMSQGRDPAVLADIYGTL